MERTGKLYLLQTSCTYTNNKSSNYTGMQGGDLATFNIIYLLANKYLYQCRCKSTFPDIDTYKLPLTNLIDTEKGICVMNNQLDIRYI